MRAEDFLDSTSVNEGLGSAADFLDAKPAKKQNKGIVGDIGTGLKRGVEQMPGMVTGLADIAAAPVSAVTGINRPFSRAADYLGEKTGFQPSKWAEQAAQEYSPEMQQSLKNVEQADGFMGTLGAIAENPRSAINLVAESLPSTLAGGILARGAMGAVTGAEKLAALRTAAAGGDAAAKSALMKAGAIAGGVGEGAVTAGQQMAQTDYEADPLKAAGAATAAGIGTGIIGGVSGRVANKIGLADIEGSIASGTLGAGKKAGKAAYAGRIAGGALQEGALEEMPQSAQEQVWQNVANGKPWDEGVGKASAQGLVAGMAMGAGVNALPGSKYVESKAQPPAEEQQPIAGLLPAPNYTGTPGDQLIANDAERQAAIDAADANAAAVYAAREAFESQLRQSVTIINEPAPLQQRIDDMLNVDASKMNPIQRANYEKTLAAAFSEPIGIRHDANQREVPFTMGEYLDAQVAAENAVRARPLKQNAAQQADARLQQVADEEGYVAPEVPVVGTLSAVANMAIQSGAHKQNQMQQAMQAAVASQKTNNEGTANAAQAKPLAQEATRTNDAQAGLASSAAQAASQGTGVAAPAAFSASVPALNAGNSVNLPATSISSLQDQLDKTEPFSEQSQLLTERLQLAVTDDAKSAIGAGEMPVYKVTDHVSVAIHPSAQKEGMIQVTRYTKDGVIGDSQYNSIDEAVRFEGLTHKPRIPSNEAIAHIENSIAAEAEYQKRKNEQQAGAGLPASTAGGSRPAPVAGFINLAAYNITNADPLKKGDSPLSGDDAIFELDVLQQRANKGKLTPDSFAQSGIASRLDTAQIMNINEQINAGDLSFIAAIRSRIEQTANQEPVKNAAPSAATVQAESAAPNQEPIKNEDDWLGALFGAAPTAAESASKEVQTNRQAQDKADRVDSAIAMLTGEIEASNAAAAEVAARNYKSNRKQIELKGDGPGKNGSLSISAINESRKRRTVEALQNASSSIKQAIEFIAENPDAAFKQVADMEAAVTKQFNEGFFGPSAKLDGQLDMAVGSLIGSGSYSGEGSAGRKLRMAAHAYASADAVSQPKTDEATEAAVDYNGDSKEVGRMVGRLYSAFHNSPKGTGDGFNPISIDDISAAIEEAKKVGITVSKRPDTSYSAVWDISTPAGNEYLAYLSPEGRGTWKSFADNAKAAPEAKQEQAPAITEPVDLGKVNSQMPEGFEARDEGTSLALYKDGKRTDIYGLSRVNGADELLRHAKMRADKAKASDADARFAKNTIFTADKVAAAKARMKAKLGTMNSGIDPELLIDGMTVAGAYIESGVRKFGDYAKAMVADLGDGVKPYLLSFYEAARAYPGLNKIGMDSQDVAASLHRTMLTQDVLDKAKEVVGESPKVEKKKPANLFEAVRLKADWGVRNIDGYTRSKAGKNQQTDYGLKGGVKDEFLADASRYLKAVAKLLESKGFTTETDKKGKAKQSVSINEGGLAVGGDVYLNMSAGDFHVYAQVGVTNVRGMGPEHPQGVSLMVRSGQKNGMNNWLSLDLTAGDLAAWFHKQHQAFAKRSAEVQPAAPAKASYDLSKADDKFKVATEIAGFLIGGGEFKTIIEARKKISEMIGRPIEAATELAKQADETIETAVVLAGRDIVKAGRKQGRTPEVIFSRLVDLYRRQPNLAVRSSTSVRDQAYSTPVPLAYLASELAGITYDTKVLEPTAGNGMLLIGASIGNSVVNELNPDRADVLRSLGFNPTERNAATEQLRHAGYPVDAVIANPPFGATKDANGETIVYDIKPGFKTREVDHAIVFKSLETMKDDGRAVLIVGGVQAEAEEARREDYRGANKRAFYFNLYNEYNVIDHFTVDGGLYSKQGASYPVDIIVIDGRGKSSRDMPAADLPVIFKSYDALKEKLNGNGRVESEPVVGAGGTDGGNGQARNGDTPAVAGSPVGSSVKDGNGSAARVGAASVRNDGPADNGRPSGSGAVSSGGQSESANASGSVDGSRVSDANRNAEAGSKAGNRGNRPDDLGGISVVNGERVESGLTDRRGQEQETGHQVAYDPHSNAASVGTLVPRAMKDSIAASLQKISDEVGSIDDYVAESLAMDLEDVKANFSAEQIDALALSIRNAEAGKGFIIGDQTGIGKGRVVAAMIRYALVTGKTPIFVTEKPNLYSDMIRDLDDIGMTAELALDTKNPKVMITNGGESIPYTLLRTENGEVVENNLLLRAPKSGKALDQIMQGMMEGDSLGEYKVIFTTYSQLQTVKGATTTRQRFIQKFGEGNYMVFDESHNAGGAGDTQARTKEQRQAAKDGESLVTGRASFVRHLVQKAFGTFFSSATYAKRPDVMDLYSSTNMKLAVDKISQLGEAIKSGGVPMQQVVANMLTKDGQYIRRERTFAGVSYDTQETKVDKGTAENMASAMRSILAFSRAKDSVIKEIQKEMDREGGMINEMGGEKSSVQGANFGSIMHNLIDQMLLSLKVQDSVSHAIERLKAGEKVVLTVSNTMGSFLKDYSEELGIATGDPVSMSFADLYNRYLEKQRNVTIKDGGGNKRQHRLTDAELGPRLVDMFNAVRKQIESSGFGSAPISPIDYMHNELRKAGYKTDEITGRTIALNYSSGTPILASRTANIRQRVKAVSGFNNGETDVLILNQAGSTGLSLHASSKFKDQRKRHMIIVQAEKNIDTHMQMLGRVHRTGQVVAPAYSQMMADIPAEMRPASVLMKKMASLNANTTASRTSSVTAEGVVDFMNNYGGQVVHEYLRDNPDVLEAVGGSKVIALGDDPAEAGEDDIRKFTGYIPILPIKQQEEVYRELVDRYNELIDRENSLGTNKLEAKAVDLDAETISSQTVTEDRGDPSVFASPANMEKVDVKRTVKPYSSEEVAAMVSESLDGKTANQIAAAQLSDLFEKATAYGKEKVAKMVADEVDPVKIDSHKAQLQLVFSHARTVLNTYKIGDSISVKDQIGQFVYGVITKIERSGRTANPAAGSAWKMHVALANGDAKSITLSFSQIGSKYDLRAENRVEWYNTDTQSVERIPVSEIFDKGAKVRREKRWIVTGNILAGFARFPGQIITYTKNDGTTAQGVLMSRQFDFEKEQKNAPVRIKDGKAAIKFFTNGGQGGIIGTPDRFLMIAPRRGEFEITVPSSKKDGGTYYLDTGLTNIVGDFYKRGSIMSASVYTTGDVERVVDYLVKGREETIIALSNVEKAKELLEGNAAAGNIAAPGSMSPADKSIYGMAAEGKSAADILKFIASASRNPMNRQVAKLLLKTGIAPSVTVGDGKGWKMNAGEGNKYAAGYNPKTDTISLFRPASSERNMLHELIHAATLKALSKKGMASAQMNALYQHVKKSGKLKGMYGMSDVDEFIAEAFSNPKFQAALKQVAAPSTSTAKSAWHWFVRVIKGILGLPSGSENALSQALEIGIGVMRENMRLNEGAGDVRYNAAPGKINQTDTEAFRKWFGDSRVVDADGKPMRVYHGTGATDIGAFNVSDRGSYGGGIYLTPEIRGANDYAIYRGAPSSTVYPVYAAIKNPASGSEAAQVASWKGEENAREELIRRGFDGVVDMRSGEIVAFYPEQIKSAIGNNGDFDATNPDIRYNVADEGGDIGRIVGDSVSDQLKAAVLRLSGRPMLDHTDPFAAENARLREQDQSLWSKAKKQLRRYLAPGGLLPQSVFAEKIKRDSEFQAVEFDVRHLIGGLEQAVKADFGIAFDKLSKEQMRPITEALAGKVPASLPEATKTAAVAMRQYIDGMSTEYLKIIQQKIDAKMLKALESGKDSDKAQAINEIELFEKIKGNIGRYVHRSYQAFDDPKWFEKVPAHVLNASRLYLKQGYMEAGENDAKASQMAEVTLHEILKNGTAYDSMESFIAESKLGAKDLSVLMRRKEVPAQIRALLGEYPDARLNFTKSATKMGRLIWNTRFLDRVRDMGMGSFFFEGKDRPPNATTQIAADGSEVYAPLNGLWTFPEIAQSFKDALGKEQMSDLYRAIVRFNGLVKYGKTVLAPTTAMRNWQSAMFFSLANGHFDLTQMKKSISAFREQVSQKATGQDLKYLRHLKQLGVVYDTPYAGEMARLMEDARMEELLSSDKGDAVRWFRKANQLAQGFYTFGDDFWKIIGFENEKAGLMKAGLSLQEAEIEAAKRIRDTYPTYSMVGRGIQWLSRFPLAGTFVSFPAEIIRTSGNMLRTVAADLKSDNPKLRELGMKRAAGMVFVSAAFYSLAALSMAMAGVGDDEDEAIRDLAPEWQKNSTFLYLGRDEKGNLRYFDMSFLDPYGYWKRPITAMLRNQPWEDSLASGLRGMLEPFIGADIAAKAIFEAVANQKENGGKVYKEKDGAINQTIDVADHLRKALQPGVVGNVERLVKAAGDVRKSSGQPYSMEDELVALVGWRATTIDPKTALYYRSFEFTDAVAEARKTITETLRDANEITPEDIADAKARAQAKQEQAFKEMHRLVSAAESAGMSKMQIVQTLRLSNISQANIGSLMRGETPDVSITPQLAARAVRQASQMRGPEYAAEVFDRYRQARAN